MDQVVQQNAANAEESSSASQELNAQSLGMRHVVINLTGLIFGEGHENSARQHARAEVDLKSEVGRKTPKKKILSAKIIDPKKIIPFDPCEENFTTF